MKYIFMSFYLILFAFTSFAQHSAGFPEILSEREQARVMDEILEERFTDLLPQLMEETGFDTWLLISREYNEDPILRTFLPATWQSARRRTILVIHRVQSNATIKGYAIARYDVGEIFQKAWDPDKEPNQWKALVNLLEDLKPQQIGINTSATFAQADGLVHTDYQELMAHLPNKLKNKVKSAEPLAAAWLETRTKRDMAIYNQVAHMGHRIIAEGFSEQVITPGVTRTSDVVWWFRDRIASLGLQAWFHPTVDIQRAGNADELYTFDSKPGDEVIMPGDWIHCDVGITYLRLNTDVQQNAYVLKSNEDDVPESLKEAFKKVLRAQDLLTQEFKTGRSGNEILKAALAANEAEGLQTTIYSHPIGYYGHGTGPAIGMWDNQNHVAGTGDYRLRPNTAYSIELNTVVEVAGWGKPLRIMTEEEAFFDGQTLYYIDGRQTAIYTIPRRPDYLKK
ncbi:MAG: aminopeptidase P family protein [Cyclobacteriaceae bacterium]|nr:aminopeptidase P family protein [Cyclobacteriaceae bacterium]MCH8516233.1 aminopeptidase P family protein [Cyclobacteriaceae bacterium]